MTTELGSLLVRIGADVSGLTSGLDSAKNSVASTGAALTRTGAKLTAGVTAPILGMGAAAVTSATKFNSSMANVATLLTDLGADAAPRLNELSAAVQDMSVTTGKSTDDLASGLYQVISAFGDSADTASILQINAMAAAAGMATTTEAINLTSAVTKGYGDSSAEAVQKVSDLAFQTVKLGQTDFPQLASAMGSVVPIASSLGVAQEELFAVMATATGVTGSASEVGTQLRGVMQSMMAPTASMAELMSTMGYESGAAMLQQLGLQGSMAAVVQAAAASGEPLQSYMGSIEGQTLALALAGPLSENFAANMTAMGAAAGATETAFVAQTQGINAFGFEMMQAKQQVTVMAQQLGQALVPAAMAALEAAQPLIGSIANLATAFANASPQMQRMVIGAAGVAAVIGPAAVGIGAMMTAASALAPVLGGVAAAIGALLSPVGLLIGAVAGVAAVIFNWGGANDKLAATLQNWGLDAAAAAVTNLHTKATALWETIKSLASGELTLGALFDVSPPEWITKLTSWVFPAIPTLELPTWFADLSAWSWPTPTTPEWITNLLAWAFPTLELPEWADTLMAWAWPILGPVAWITTLTAWAWPVLTSPEWITNLLAWAFPTINAPEWITNLLAWSWPILAPVAWATKLVGWSWPELSQPGWLGKLLSFRWPSFPALPGWLGGGGNNGDVGNNAAGTTSWRGGLTMVGEQGPELVALPPMSRIWSNRQSDEIVGAAAAAGGPVVGTVIVNNGLDVEELAYRVAGLRRRRGVR